MYFPYLRGKQYEWITIRELSRLISQNEQIFPIMEPVKRNFSNLRRSIELIMTNNAPIVIIVNPQIGELSNNTEALRFELENIGFMDYRNAYLGYIINGRTRIREVNRFFDAFSDNNLCLVHRFNFSDTTNLIDIINGFDKFSYNIFIESETGRRYRRSFTDIRKVIIEDGFEKRRNEDYPEEEFFSDLHLEFRHQGYDGFGDYLIVGDNYSETGGPAHAVAIHLTYINQDEEIWVKHFVSDTTGDPLDPAGKFMEALDKVVEYLQGDDNEIFISSACQEFIDLHNAERFPGLGYVKKLSMKHHIELINAQIR